MIARKLMKNKRMSNGSFSSMMGSIMSICRVKPIAPAFSLMEMMVVMLVVAVIMALAAPMITKRSGVGGGSTGCLWTSITGGHLGYNLAQEAGRSVMIGAKESAPATMSNEVSSWLTGSVSDGYSPRMILSSKPQGQVSIPQLGFMREEEALGIMALDTGNKMFIGGGGTKTSPDAGIEDSIAIGYNAVALAKDTIAIGHDIMASNKEAVAIGSMDSKVPGEQSVSIGIGASTEEGGAVAIGYKVSAKDDGIAIGKHQAVKAENAGVVIGTEGAQATGRDSVAIGKTAKAIGDTSMALGSGSTASAKCDAIGTGATCSQNDTIVIGTPDKKVIINAKKIEIVGKEDVLIESKGFGLADLTLKSGHNMKLEADTYVDFDSMYVRSNAEMFTVEGYIKSVAGFTTDAWLFAEGGIDTGGAVTADGGISGSYVYTEGNVTAEGDVIAGYSYSLSTAYRWADVGYCSCSPSYSDKRLKDVIGENLDAMDKINQLKVYNFTFKDDEEKTPRVGVMAQDLRKIFPNAVFEGDDGYLKIRHEDMFYAMINALKELDAKIKAIATQIADNIKVVAEQKAEITALKAKVDKQDKEIEELKDEIKDLKKIVNKLAK